MLREYTAAAEEPGEQTMESGSEALGLVRWMEEPTSVYPEAERRIQAVVVAHVVEVLRILGVEVVVHHIHKAAEVAGHQMQAQEEALGRIQEKQQAPDCRRN